MNSDDKRKSYVVILSLIILAILSFLSLVSLKTGIVGGLIRKILFSLFGFGGYLIPIFIIYSSTVIYRNKKDSYKNIIYIVILFLCLLIVMDIYNNGNIITISDRIGENLELSREGLGSGIIGAVLGFIFLKLFGSIGTYLILSVVILLSTFNFTNIDIRIILKDTKDSFLKYIDKFKEENSFKFDVQKYIGKFKNIFKNDKDIEVEYEHDETIVEESFEHTIFDEDGSIVEAVKKEEEERKEVLAEEDNKSEMESDIIITDYSEKMDLSSSDESIKSKKKSSKNNKDIEYIFPGIDLLNKPKINKNIDKKSTLEKASRIEKTMKDFNIDARVSKINRGPTITCYELEPAPGVKVSRILSLSDDLALALATSDIRIEAPIPGKAAIGIEVPNTIKDNVLLREILEDKEFIEDENDIPLVLGKDISGDPIISSIDRMPHLLIAGATGSGKSVCINTIIASILYKANPENVKLLLIDPKVVELSIYNDIPHLLLPVVTSPKDARFALKWAVDEMERRYELFADSNVRDIKSYNKQVNEASLPKIIIIIDELSDLMMVSAQEIEDYICRLAQMARAAGIYLIVATQRPSVDVITGTIKANIPSRISFAVSSQIDSRTILDMSGAEKLLGKGDMLFYPSNYSKPKRIQGAFISDDEVFNVVKFVKEKNEADYDEKVMDDIKENIEINKAGPRDELLEDALRLVVSNGEASISMLQRRLRIGYNRAANIVDYMCDNGYVGEQDGNKPRVVLITEDDIDNII